MSTSKSCFEDVNFSILQIGEMSPLSRKQFALMLDIQLDTLDWTCPSRHLGKSNFGRQDEGLKKLF